MPSVIEIPEEVNSTGWPELRTSRAPPTPSMFSGATSGATAARSRSFRRAGIPPTTRKLAQGGAAHVEQIRVEPDERFEGRHPRLSKPSYGDDPPRFVRHLRSPQRGATAAPNFSTSSLSRGTCSPVARSTSPGLRRTPAWRGGSKTEGFRRRVGAPAAVTPASARQAGLLRRDWRHSHRGKPFPTPT